MRLLWNLARNNFRQNVETQNNVRRIELKGGTKLFRGDMSVPVRIQVSTYVCVNVCMYVYVCESNEGKKKMFQLKHS